MVLPWLTPPVTSTDPSFSIVAVCPSRVACKPPVPANVAFVGLKTSAAARIVPLKSPPPAISTVPSLSLEWAADGKGFFVAIAVQGGQVLLHVDLQSNAQVLRKSQGVRKLRPAFPPMGATSQSTT
jgi:hypothetical protein